MKKYLSVLLLLCLSCDVFNSDSENETIFYDEKYAVYITPDTDALIPIGYTSQGELTFNKKQYFPTFYDTLTFYGTDAFNKPTNEFTLFDYTTGRFNIFLRDTITNYEWEIPSVEIIDGINNISIN